MDGDTPWIAVGAAVYDQDGRNLGTVKGYTETGIEVELNEQVEELTLKRAATADFGEGMLVWQCGQCGQVGDLDDIPEECPNCGAPEEELFAAIED